MVLCYWEVVGHLRGEAEWEVFGSLEEGHILAEIVVPGPLLTLLISRNEVVSAPHSIICSGTDPKQ